MALKDDDVQRTLATVIGAGAVPRDEIGARLRAAGLRVTAEKVDRQLQFDTSFGELTAGVIHLPQLADGVAFALEVDPATAAEDYVLMHPALEAIGWWIVAGEIDLFDDDDGRRLGTVESDGWLIDGVDTDVVIGPEGWLDDAVGGWIALRVRSGALVKERLPGPPDADPARAAALRAAFELVAARHQHVPLDADEPVEIAEADLAETVQEAMLRDRSVFAGDPVDLGDGLLAAAGLRAHGHRVVLAHVDEAVVDAASNERRAMARWGVDADTVLGVQMVLAAMSMHGEGHPDAFGVSERERDSSPAFFAVLLETEPITRAVGFELADDAMALRVVDFAREIQAALGDDPAIWGPFWLEAHAHLALGDFDAAAPLLDGLPPGLDSLPVLVDRATVAVERSEGRFAQRLVVQAARLVDDLPDAALLTYTYREMVEELHDEVEPWAAGPPPAARRNDRCPCGSGRKYKACHLGRDVHPIEERAAWLHQKMVRFVHTTEPHEVESLASTLAGAMESPQSWASLVDSPFLADLVLHEDEAAQEYLDGRSTVLPADEVLLAQQWLLVERSVFEVESSGPGRLGLRDLATGDMVEVTRVGPGPSPARGSIVLGRPLPVGDTYRAFSGFMAVRPDLVREAMAIVEDGDPDALVEFVGSMHRPPRISNTDGEEMVLTDLTWSLPDGVDAAGALAAAGFDTEGPTWTLVRDTTNQRRSVIASVRVEGDRLEGHVNSAERADELLALIAAHVPGAELLDTKVVDLDDIDLTDPPDPADRPPVVDDPEMLAAMAAHMAEYEAEWLDLTIPALGGRTPREAAADPVAREELVRLLATFPEPEGDAIGMSAARLRVALGL